MDPTVQKNRVADDPKKDATGELNDLKCPKLTIDQEKKLIFGEGIALNSAKEFNRYIGNAIDRQGRAFANAISTGAEQIIRDIGLGQTTKRELLEQERNRQELEMSIRSQKRKKNSADLEEEEKLLRASRDELKLEKRQDMASKGESDGGDLKSKNPESQVDESQELKGDSFEPHFEDDS